LSSLLSGPHRRARTLYMPFRTANCTLHPWGKAVREKFGRNLNSFTSHRSRRREVKLRSPIARTASRLPSANRYCSASIDRWRGGRSPRRGTTRLRAEAETAEAPSEMSGCLRARGKERPSRSRGWRGGGGEGPLRATAKERATKKTASVFFFLLRRGT